MKPMIKTNYYDNGQKWYKVCYSNNKFHNENGPAYQEWFANGEIWREEYFLNGKRVTKKQVMTLMKIKKFLDGT